MVPKHQNELTQMLTQLAQYPLDQLCDDDVSQTDISHIPVMEYLGIEGRSSLVGVEKGVRIDNVLQMEKGNQSKQLTKTPIHQECRDYHIHVFYQ